MADASPNPDVPSYILDSLHNWTLAYYLWTTVFVVLAILAIVMPLIVASGLIADNQSKTSRMVISLIGGIAAALFTGFRPNEYASGFDAAQAALGSAVVSYRLNTINNAQLASEYQRARNLTVFRYPSLNPTPLSPLPTAQQVPGSPSAPPHP
jgi:hypothetical protein